MGVPPYRHGGLISINVFVLGGGTPPVWVRARDKQDIGGIGVIKHIGGVGLNGVLLIYGEGGAFIFDEVIGFGFGFLLVSGFDCSWDGYGLTGGIGDFDEPGFPY